MFSLVTHLMYSLSLLCSVCDVYGLLSEISIVTILLLCKHKHIYNIYSSVTSKYLCNSLSSTVILLFRTVE